MNAAVPTHLNVPKRLNARRSVIGEHPASFIDLYQEDTNIVIWQRKLNDALQESVARFLTTNTYFKSVMTVTPDSTYEAVIEALGRFDGADVISEDVALLVDMFCCLFELKRAGLRFSVLNQAMCPRFHVDKVPCRLITTYQGVATEWLADKDVDRSKLGAGNLGKVDAESGLYRSSRDIQQLNQGDVALLKGELWVGNENAGLVHRSPAVADKQPRLMLTLDFIS